MADYNLGPFRFNLKGEYDDNIEYKYLDVVNYNGSSYVCKYKGNDFEPTQGIKPVDDSTGKFSVRWDLIAAKGDKGDTADAYLPFEYLVPDDGVINWDIKDTDKIAVFGEAISKININNTYSGLCGIMVTDQDLTIDQLPENSDLSVDYYYISARNDQYFIYTFVCMPDPNNINTNRLIWNRGVINGPTI